MILLSSDMIGQICTTSSNLVSFFFWREWDGDHMKCGTQIISAVINSIGMHGGVPLQGGAGNPNTVSVVSGFCKRQVIGLTYIYHLLLDSATIARYQARQF